MFSRRKFAVIVFAIIVPVVVPATVSSAQTGPSIACSGDFTGLWPNVGFGGRASILAQHTSRPSQRTISAFVPAGTYDVTAVSYDGYDGRSTVFQKLEQYFLEFLDAGGNVLATTGATDDLLDGVEETTRSTFVGEISLAADAVEVRAVHLFAGQSVGTQSVAPSCFGATSTTVPPSSSTTTTTTATTTQPPPASSTSTTTTTTTPAAQTTTTTLTITTVPTLVLPEVEQSPDPDPTNATPTFTG